MYYNFMANIFTIIHYSRRSTTSEYPRFGVRSTVATIVSSTCASSGEAPAANNGITYCDGPNGGTNGADWTIDTTQISGSTITYQIHDGRIVSLREMIIVAEPMDSRFRLFASPVFISFICHLQYSRRLETPLARKTSRTPITASLALADPAAALQPFAHTR